MFVAQRKPRAPRARRALVTDSDEENEETEHDRILRETEEAKRARTAPARSRRGANAAQKVMIATEEDDKANVKTVLAAQQHLAQKHPGFNENTTKLLFDLYSHKGDRKMLFAMLEKNEQTKVNKQLRQDKAIEQEAHLEDLAQAQRANTAKKKADERAHELAVAVEGDTSDPDELDLRRFARFNELSRPASIAEIFASYMGDVMVGAAVAAKKLCQRADEQPTDDPEEERRGKKRKLAAGDLRAYLIKLFNQDRDPDPDDFAVLAGLLAAAVGEDSDEEPAAEPEPEPGPEPHPQPEPAAGKHTVTATEAEVAELQKKIAKLEQHMKSCVELDMIEELAGELKPNQYDVTHVQTKQIAKIEQLLRGAKMKLQSV